MKSDLSLTHLIVESGSDHGDFWSTDFDLLQQNYIFKRFAFNQSNNHLPFYYISKWVPTPQTSPALSLWQRKTFTS